jgi:hypothetical protein
MKILLAIFSLLVFVGTASADSFWTYTGKAMTGCNCSLDGTVKLDSLGNATSWDFTDGTHSLTDANSSGAIHPPGTDPNQFFPTAWFVDLSGVGLFIHSQFDGSAFESNDSFSGPGFAEAEQGNPGVWTSKMVTTPEPATGLLVASGLLFVGIMRRKRRKYLDSATWDKLA